MASSERYGQAYDHEAITISTTAIGFTSTKVVPDNDQNPRPAFEAYVTVETDKVRYRLDGTDPTSTTGHELAAGDTLTITGTNNIRRAKFIRSGTGDATLRVTYSR